MPYNLQQKQTAFKGGKNILASEHFQYIEVGATLKGGFAYALGEAIGKVSSGADKGLWVKYVNGATYDDLAILNIDVANIPTNTAVGEVLIKGSVYGAKLPASVTAEFKTKTPLIRYVTR